MEQFYRLAGSQSQIVFFSEGLKLIPGSGETKIIPPRDLATTAISQKSKLLIDMI
jgi:hypothetical protein